MSSPVTTRADVDTTRVLLVEDDVADAFLVRELLLEVAAPVEIQEAHTLGEALSGAHLLADCVLLDLGLPDSIGMDALHRIVDAAPQAAVLVLTGLDDEHRGVSAVAAGAQDYLVKGQVDGTLLARSIRYAVERKRADLQLRRLYATELRAAENARLERGLLPHPEVRDPRLHVTTSYQPGRDAVLGGDFYDVVESEDGRLHVLIGDVAGHGPDEAALGVCLRIAWRALVLSGLDPTGLLPVLEQVLVRERRSEEVFATLCMLVVAADRRELRVFLAGHPAPILLGREPAQLPDDTVGPALGVLPGVVWGSRLVRLDLPWRVMLFSDGLVEGRVPDSADRLGVDTLLRLAAASDAYADDTCLVSHLVAEAERLNGGALTDDVAVVLLSCGRP